MRTRGEPLIGGHDLLVYYSYKGTTTRTVVPWAGVLVISSFPPKR